MMTKKIGLFIMLIFALLLVTGCGAKKEEKKEANVEGTLTEIMEKIYSDIPEEERPMMLTNMELNEENIEGFIGTTDIEYKEALASEPGIGSIAHSVVLVRAKDVKDVDDIKKKIKENVNPRKWVCVGVEEEDVIIKSKGDLVILILVENEETRETLDAGFDAL